MNKNYKYTIEVMKDISIIYAYDLNKCFRWCSTRVVKLFGHALEFASEATSVHKVRKQ